MGQIGGNLATGTDIFSMTGFARVSGEALGRAWTWEAKSVNGRGLDVRCRVPSGYDRLEVLARAAATRRFDRGNIALTLAIAERAAAQRLRINREALDQVLALIGDLGGRIAAAPPRLDGLLALRGVIEAAEEEPEADEIVAVRDRAMLTSLEETLAALAAARAGEGRSLAGTLIAHLDEIERLCGDAGRHAAAQPAAIKARIEAQLTELLGGQPALPPERLAQEAAMMAARADVREELDRLVAHIGAARALLAGGGAIGRKLDFLAQEFNREANTLCSKSADVELTRIGLALKAAIDRLREQSANIE